MGRFNWSLSCTLLFDIIHKVDIRKDKWNRDLHINASYWPFLFTSWFKVIDSNGAIQARIEVIDTFSSVKEIDHEKRQ